MVVQYIEMHTQYGDIAHTCSVTVNNSIIGLYNYQETQVLMNAIKC